MDRLLSGLAILAVAGCLVVAVPWAGALVVAFAAYLFVRSLVLRARTQ